MLKKVVILLLAAEIMTGTATAGPLTDYSSGNTAIDLTWKPSLQLSDQFINFSNQSDTNQGDGENSTFHWGITTGFGKGWAIQYKQANSTRESIPDENYNFGVKSQEVNVLYQLNTSGNLAVFAGYHQAKFVYTENNHNAIPDTKNTLQLGLVGVYPMTAKTNLYGVVGAGKGLFNYELGLSYELAKNIDFNANYQYKKVRDLQSNWETNPFTDDVTTKGFGYGITYKF